MSHQLQNGKRRRRVDEVASKSASPSQLNLPHQKYQLDTEVYREIASLRQETKVLDQKLNTIYLVLNELKGALEKQEKNFENMNALLQPPPLPKELPSYYS